MEKTEDQNIDFGVTRVGGDASRTVSLFNHSKKKIEITFDVEGQLEELKKQFIQIVPSSAFSINPREKNDIEFSFKPTARSHAFKTPIFYKIIENQDKKQLMYEKDLYAIVDYWIPQPKQKKITLEELIKQYNIKNEIVVDLMAIYVLIKDSLKGKSAEEKLSILLSHLEIGYKSASNAYKHMHNILSSSSSESARKYIDTGVSELLIEPIK